MLIYLWLQNDIFSFIKFGFDHHITVIINYLYIFDSAIEPDREMVAGIFNTVRSADGPRRDAWESLVRTSEGCEEVFIGFPFPEGRAAMTVKWWRTH